VRAWHEAGSAPEEPRLALSAEGKDGRAIGLLDPYPATPRAHASLRSPVMTATIDRILSIGADPGDTTDERSRKRLLVGVALLILPVAFVWGCLYWGFGEHGVALTPWAYVAGSAISLAVFARTRNFAFLRTAQFLLILVAPALGTILVGGIDESSTVFVWSLLAPLGAVAFDRPDRAWPWFAAFVAAVVLSVPLSELVRPEGADLPNGFVRAFDVLNIVLVSFVAMLLLVTFARGRETAQARVEALLLNVLPAEVAQRLQSDPQSIADQFDDASILFADVVDFTPLSGGLDAREVVELLDRLFTSFDELVDRHDVEKIKTIGDCYMVAAGVPTPRRDHAQALAGLALDMRESARSCLPEGMEHDLRLRIGISSGPVVAGVIGRRRFLYDLWGDTVNMASRMESHGTPDCIQITRPTWELLRGDFEAEPLGLVEVKGKGRVETWRLVGPRGR
jgi:adenylate cyclase